MERPQAAPIVASTSVDVPISPSEAFELFTERTTSWWRLDSPYWNDHERRRGLRFEPQVGGRLIEVYDEATGEGFEIGRVSVWEPGRRLVYGWRQADWPADESTQVEVLFEAIDDGTRVTLHHGGWEKLTQGVELSGGYQAGHRELLGWYQERARA
jgi:uncharacterized protein YndB with AHSA1/START domain